MKKLLWIPLLSSIATMGLLFLTGSVFDIDVFEIKLFQNEPLKEDVIFDVEFAFLPIAFGLGVGFIVERIVKARSKRLN